MKKWLPGITLGVLLLVLATPTVSPVALLGGLGMIAVASGYVIYAGLRKLGWGYLGLGAVGWVVAVVLKFIWAIPINPRVFALARGIPQPIGVLLFELYVGVLTGVFEVGLVWLVMRYTRLGRVPFNRALAFGIGFGAVEALVLGLSSLLTVATAMLAPNTIPPAALQQVAVLNNVLFGLAPIVERFFTILIHIFANVLIFYAVVQRQTRWFWLAFVYKTLIDAAAAYGQLTGINTLGRLWGLEAVVVVWGVLGWLGTRWIQRRYPKDPDASPRLASPGYEE
jgi:uncharacterized membrane protein YhfC